MMIEEMLMWRRLNSNELLRERRFTREFLASFGDGSSSWLVDDL
jgi:hypothetical protein